MKARFRYLYWGYLSALSLLTGFALLDYIQFLQLFFDANTFDVAVLVFLFLASAIISYKYLQVGKNIAFIVQVFFLISLVMTNQVKEAVLLFPDFLSILIYACFILSGSTLAVLTKRSTAPKNVLALGIVILCICAGAGIGSFTPEGLPRQKKYHDKLIFSDETPFQKIDVTSWKGNQWFYFNEINQFSTLDEWMYYEPMVHPVMLLSEGGENILVIGGENGLIARELGKHKGVHKINILPIDTAFYSLGEKHPVFTAINKEALNDEKIERIEGDAFRYLNKSKNHYDAIFIDVPDPVDLELNQYYTREFYQLCRQALKSEGIMITQAGSPYYATKAFYAISKTIESANFNILPLHNQVMTLGEWGWVIASKILSTDQLKEKCKKLEFDKMQTRWINTEAMRMMMSFGKPYPITDSIEINSLKNPVIHQYYSVGTWNFD
ncbi:hypothetical protein [Reichenbachiella sp. MALMAid0571]|uniref:spermine/spermidine synthase domain-containing protein n=1 Tax=Reichenbachiella sp. MALMAid0571 TaxID=3143939 RepID=UPI0032DE646F